MRNHWAWRQWKRFVRTHNRMTFSIGLWRTSRARRQWHVVHSSTAHLRRHTVRTRIKTSLSTRSRRKRCSITVLRLLSMWRHMLLHADTRRWSRRWKSTLSTYRSSKSISTNWPFWQLLIRSLIHGLLRIIVIIAKTLLMSHLGWFILLLELKNILVVLLLVLHIPLLPSAEHGFLT